MNKAVDTIEVSVVMPCLNEAITVKKCIEKAQSALAAHNIKGEIIIADNGSTDGSYQIAEECGARVVHVSTKGYGSALMAGISAACGEYIIMGDADDSYDFSQILPFIEKLRAGYDLVMGCRLPRGGGKIMPGAMPWKHRWIGNPVLTTIGRVFFKSPVSDFHCGLRAFRVAAYKNMDLHTTGMEFASEMVIKATLKGMRIAEIPITLYKDGRMRKPHLRSWRDGWRHLRFMLLFSPRWLFLIPGIVLFLLGGGLGGLLLTGPVRIDTVSFDVNTLLICAMAVLVGFQLILFAIFTKVFAISERLLPEDPRIDWIFKVTKLEMGVLAGLMFSVVGFALLLWSTLYWKQYNFGPIPYSDSLRAVIPGVISLTLGIEIIFSSFFLSILGMGRK